MEKDELNGLTDLLDSISFIRESLQGIAFNEFRTDRRLMILIIKEFGNIIEIIGNFTPEFKEKYSDVPWNETIDLILLFVNSTFGVDEEIVWKASKIELRHLEKLINDVFFRR